MAIEDIRAERVAKLEKLKEAGMEPYPARTERTHEIERFLSEHASLEASKAGVTLTGRVMSIREHGGAIFADLYDGTGKAQGYLRRDMLGEEAFKLFEGAADVGDFIELTGTAFTTKRGMPSLEAKEWRMLAKALIPIPDEWYGLKDEEERYRKRYLDILLSEQVAARIKRRSQFWNVIRTFLLQRGFTEVETPALETVPGGADARPFIAHHNALDMEVYLRISAGELWQKRLLVAGLPKIFEIGRIFRNEGMSYEHLQDYTQVEFYEAYKDYRAGMEMVKELYRAIAKEVYGRLDFEIRGHQVDLGEEWQEYDFGSLMKDRFGFDPITEIYGKTGKRVTLEDLQEICIAAGIAYEHAEFNIARTTDNLWKVLRKELSGPGFLTGVPVFMEPLAKRTPGGKTVERFQVIIAGSEVGKGYSELNDPTDQRARFAEQQALRDAGDEEAQMADLDFVEALEYGMPPALGFGVSERLFSFFEGESAREAQTFPLMRPRGQ